MDGVAVEVVAAEGAVAVDAADDHGEEFGLGMHPPEYVASAQQANALGETASGDSRRPSPRSH